MTIKDEHGRAILMCGHPKACLVPTHEGSGKLSCEWCEQIINMRKMLDNSSRAFGALEIEVDKLRRMLRRVVNDSKDDENSAAIEASWKERQGEDYGSY